VRSFIASNEGNETLIVSAVRSDLPEFTPLPPSFNLAPGGTQAVVVTFRPAVAGPLAGTLTLESNDPFHPATHVGLSGTGEEPAAPTIEPGAVALTLFTGGNAEAILTLGNAGLGRLDFSVVIAVHSAPGCLTAPTRDLVVESAVEAAAAASDGEISSLPPSAGNATPSACDARFLSVDPLSGSVAPGETTVLRARLEAAGAPPGTYVGEIGIDTNDPSTPRLTVPVILTVLGGPNLTLSTTSWEVAASGPFGTAAAVSSFALPLGQLPVAGGTLELVAAGDFGTSAETATVSVEGTVLGSVGSRGYDCEPATGTFAIAASALRASAADGVVNVRVENSAAVDLFCAANSHFVRLRFGVGAGGLDYGGVTDGDPGRPGDRCRRAWLLGLASLRHAPSRWLHPGQRHLRSFRGRGDTNRVAHREQRPG
jgi:hypothetical protein